MSRTVLYKLMRPFKPTPDQVPELLLAAGVHVVGHRKPSAHMDVFSGVVQLNQDDALIEVSMGMTPTVGAIMALRAPAGACVRRMADLSAAADHWFHQHWSARFG